MAQTSLDYDKIIWEVFAVGVVSSIVLFYYSLFGKIEKDLFKILALSIGFAILIYSFILILGYGFKKSRLEKIIREGYIDNNNHIQQVNEEDNLIQRELGQVLRRSWYPRVRWMGEFILFCMILIYGFLFINKFRSIALISILFILILFVSMCIRANYCARLNWENPPQEIENREEWQCCGNYFKKYFGYK